MKLTLERSTIELALGGGIRHVPAPSVPFSISMWKSRVGGHQPLGYIGNPCAPNTLNKSLTILCDLP